MIEWLLSDNGELILYGLLSLILISPIITLGLYLKIKNEYEPSSLALFITIISTILIGFPIFYTALSIKTEYVSDESWKQVYTNDDDIKVQIKIDNYDLLIRGKEKLIAGENIELAQYKALKSSINNKIIVEKNGTSYSKKVIIEENDIISNSDINLNSKLIKIEYKNIKGHQRTLFGYKGPIEKDILRDNPDGKLRITLEQDSTEKELKQMFESQN